MHRRYIRTDVCTNLRYVPAVHVHARYRSTIVSTYQQPACPPAAVCCLLSAVSRLSGLRLLQACRSTGRYSLPTPCSLNTRRGRALPTFHTKGKRVHSLTRSGQGTEEMGRQKRKKKGMSQSSSAVHFTPSSRVGSLPDGLSALLLRILHIAV